MPQTNTPIPTEREQAFLEAIEIAELFEQAAKTGWEAALASRNEKLCIAYDEGINTAKAISDAIRNLMLPPLETVPVDFEPDEGCSG